MDLDGKESSSKRFEDGLATWWKEYSTKHSGFLMVIALGGISGFFLFFNNTMKSKSSTPLTDFYHRAYENGIFVNLRSWYDIVWSQIDWSYDYVYAGLLCFLVLLMVIMDVLTGKYRKALYTCGISVVAYSLLPSVLSFSVTILDTYKDLIEEFIGAGSDFHSPDKIGLSLVYLGLLYGLCFVNMLRFAWTFILGFMAPFGMMMYVRAEKSERSKNAGGRLIRYFQYNLLAFWYTGAAILFFGAMVYYIEAHNPSFQWLVLPIALLFAFYFHPTFSKVFLEMIFVDDPRRSLKNQADLSESQTK